jgi:hypothetical protein
MGFEESCENRFMTTPHSNGQEKDQTQQMVQENMTVTDISGAFRNTGPVKGASFSITWRCVHEKRFEPDASDLLGQSRSQRYDA